MTTKFKPKLVRAFIRNAAEISVGRKSQLQRQVKNNQLSVDVLSSHDSAPKNTVSFAANLQSREWWKKKGKWRYSSENTRLPRFHNSDLQRKKWWMVWNSVRQTRVCSRSACSSSKHAVLTFVQVSRFLDNTAVMIALTRTQSDPGREGQLTLVRLRHSWKL